MSKISILSSPTTSHLVLGSEGNPAGLEPLDRNLSLLSYILLVAHFSAHLSLAFTIPSITPMRGTEVSQIYADDRMETRFSV